MQKIKNGDTVSVNYTGKLEDGTIFDSSLVEGREPLNAVLGQGQLISGFEKGLLEMSVGEKKTVEIEHTEAYGEIVKEMIIEVAKNQVAPKKKTTVQISTTGGGVQDARAKGQFFEFKLSIVPGPNAKPAAPAAAPAAEPAAPQQ